MGLAERADVIVDFTNVPIGQLRPRATSVPMSRSGAAPGDDFDPSDPGPRARSCNSASSPPAAPDPTTPPRFLVLPAITPLPAPAVTRPLGPDREGRRRRARTTSRRGVEVEGPIEAAPRQRSSTGIRCERAVDGSRDREPGARRHRGLGVLQHHRRRAPDARPRGRRSRWSIAKASCSMAERRGGSCRSTPDGTVDRPRAVGDRASRTP